MENKVGKTSIISSLTDIRNIRSSTVEEPEQTSSKPFINIWQCMTAPIVRSSAYHACINAALAWSI